MDNENLNEIENPVTENAVTNDATVVVAAPAATEMGSGIGTPVIDRDEWDKILAEMDSKQEKPEEETPEEAPVVETAAVAAGETKKMKKEKKAKKQKPKKKKKLGKILLILFLICLVIGLAAGAYGYKYVKDLIARTPEIDPNNIYSLLSENSVVVDKNGEILDYLFEGSSLRTNVEYKDIPQEMIWALVCTEDKTFFEHNGFNYVRMVGAVWDTVKSGFKKRVGGTSTITQQLARNLYLEDIKGERTINRKIQEAYYTIILEKSLSKEQILEAYLNTVYLGFNAEGIQAAATAYFGKDVKDLSLIECAMLASLPQSPNKYSPLKRLSVDDIDDPEKYDIITKDRTYVTYYNGALEDRVWLILKNMVTNGKLITQEDFDALEPQLHDLCRAAMNPVDVINSNDKITSYFVDYAVDCVLKDMQEQMGLTEEEARNLLYKGGLTIHTTLDLDIQKSVEASYQNDKLFPPAATGAWNTKFNESMNILQENGKLMFMRFTNLFTRLDPETLEPTTIFALDGVYEFKLKPHHYEFNNNGDLIIYKDKNLNFYRTQVGDVENITVEFKPWYGYINGNIYTSNGGYIDIPAKYKSRDEKGNLVISANYFTDTNESGKLLHEDSFVRNEDGTITVSQDIMHVDKAVIQPQSAFVLIESATGKIEAMIGGRNIEGSKLYNRALSPRQPGSSFKPLAIYSTVLQKGFTNAMANMRDGGDRPVYTTATVIDDIPTVYDGRIWPVNSEGHYWGNVTLTYAIQQSLNCSAVSLFENVLTPEEIIKQIQNYGITSLQLSGEFNDVNSSGLALGGLVNGVSPLEMAAAYATIGNYGVYNSPTAYTTVTNKHGEVILTAKTESHRVLDTEVASLMLDLLKSVVTNGMGYYANLNGIQATAGKTGTTSDNYDLWFCGLTPKYSAAFWTGSDYNLYVDGASGDITTKTWKTIMTPIAKKTPYQDFQLKGNAGFVRVDVDKKTGMLPVTGKGEGLDTPQNEINTVLFIAGTQPMKADETRRVMVEICLETGYLATPKCQEEGCTGMKRCLQRVSGQSWESILKSYKLDINDNAKAALYSRVDDYVTDVPDFYCHKHNDDKKQYPVSPFAGKTKYDTSKVEKIEKEEEEDPENPDEENPDNPGTDPTPVDPTPVDPTPVDPTPVDPTPVDPTPVDPTPVDPTPVDPTPVDPTPTEPDPAPDDNGGEYSN